MKRKGLDESEELNPSQVVLLRIFFEAVWNIRSELFGPDLWHVLLLLFLGGVAHHLVDTEVRVGAVTESDGRGHSRHFLHHNDMIEVTQSRATVFD